VDSGKLDKQLIALELLAVEIIHGSYSSALFLELLRRP
jgi:hypothetical protein